jgi:hypothetical protein
MGIGHRAEGRRGKSEGGKEAKLRDGEAEESGELGEQTVLMLRFAADENLNYNIVRGLLRS